MNKTTAWPFFVALLYTFIVPFWAGWYGKTDLAWLALLGGVFATIAIRLSDLVEIKIGPLRAKLKDAIDEAHATIEQLRGLAGPIAEFMFIVMARGSMDEKNFPFEYKYRLVQTMEHALNSIGTDPQQIEKAKNVRYQITAYKMAIPIAYEIHNVLSNHFNENSMAFTSLPPMGSPDFEKANKAIVDKHNELMELMKRLNSISRIRDDFFPIPKELKNFIVLCPILTEAEKKRLLFELEDQFENFEYFIEHCKFRSADDKALT